MVRWRWLIVNRLYAKCIPTFTDCTIAELEKLGDKFRLALRVAKDPRWARVRCDHPGTYADDCLVDRVSFREFGSYGMTWSNWVEDHKTQNLHRGDER